MAFPSKAQCESFADAAKWIPKREWTYAANDGISPDKLYDFLFTIYSAKYASYKKLVKHPVYKWFSHDQNACAAFRTLRYRLNEVGSIEDVVSRIVLRLSDHPRAIFSEINRNYIVTTIAGIVRAFYDYHYTERWEIIVSTGRDLGTLITGVKKGINSFEQQLAKLAPLDEFYIGSSIEPAQGMLRDIQRIKERLNAFSDPAEFLLPSRRLDEKARERILVFDLATLFRRAYGRDKPAAITNFLRVEGIHNPIDQRTIERLLSEWKMAREAARNAHAKARSLKQLVR